MFLTHNDLVHLHCINIDEGTFAFYAVVEFFDVYAVHIDKLNIFVLL